MSEHAARKRFPSSVTQHYVAVNDRPFQPSLERYFETSGLPPGRSYLRFYDNRRLRSTQNTTTVGDRVYVVLSPIRETVIYVQLCILRLKAKPLNPRVIAEKGGRVLAAYCDCMAGLGEACTRVAALLFAIEATAKVRDSKTATEEKVYWLLPGGVKGVTYNEVSDIDHVCTYQDEALGHFHFFPADTNSETQSVRQVVSLWKHSRICLVSVNVS
ncbi:hypothetical protein LSAT2_018697 [Lamellibrachia satsuma]|nr:hypothetical protein LSAT2_018697 [Lamellibrachia satsuma]